MSRGARLKRLNEYVPRGIFLGRKLLLIVTFIIIGISLLLISHAATPVTTIEAEKGITTGGSVNVYPSSTASANNYVKFGAQGPSSNPVLRRGSGADADKFVDGTGKIIQLAGVNRSGTEFACANQDVNAFTMGVNGVDRGTDPTYAKVTMQALLTWDKHQPAVTTGPHAINTVRIPLNEDCWLGINHTPLGISGAPYRQFIQDMVDQATAQKMYVVLDLHWGEMGTGFNLGQNVAPNEDHSIEFWNQVSKKFGTQMGYTNVAFDLFNEPAIGCYNNALLPNKLATDPVINNGCPADVAADYIKSDDWAWTLARDGTKGTGFTYKYIQGFCHPNPPNGDGACWGDFTYYDNRPNQTIKVAGTQELLDAIRANGAHNVVMVEALGGGSGYIDEMGKYLPVDSYSPSQVAVSFHTYGGFNIADAGGADFILNKTVNGHWPVFLGEFGSSDCPYTNHTYTNNTIDYALNNHYGFTAWAWEDNQKCYNTLVLNNDTGDPSPFGIDIRSRLQALQP